MIVGIDLDNTIINYENSFKKIDLGFSKPAAETKGSENSFKTSI